jgi:hypothetical protein
LGVMVWQTGIYLLEGAGEVRSWMGNKFQVEYMKMKNDDLKSSEIWRPAWNWKMGIKYR